MDEKRTLTDDDVKAIAAQLEKNITERFQINVGQGVLRLVWRVCIYALIALAAYGSAGGFKKFL